MSGGPRLRRVPTCDLEEVRLAARRPREAAGKEPPVGQHDPEGLLCRSSGLCRIAGERDSMAEEREKTPEETADRAWSYHCDVHG